MADAEAERPAPARWTYVHQGGQHLVFGWKAARCVLKTGKRKCGCRWLLHAQVALHLQRFADSSMRRPLELWRARADSRSAECVFGSCKGDAGSSLSAEADTRETKTSRRRAGGGVRSPSSLREASLSTLGSGVLCDEEASNAEREASDAATFSLRPLSCSWGRAHLRWTGRGDSLCVGPPRPPSFFGIPWQYVGGQALVLPSREFLETLRGHASAAPEGADGGAPSEACSPRSESFSHRFQPAVATLPSDSKDDSAKSAGASSAPRFCGRAGPAHGVCTPCGEHLWGRLCEATAALPLGAVDGELWVCKALSDLKAISQKRGSCSREAFAWSTARRLCVLERDFAAPPSESGQKRHCFFVCVELKPKCGVPELREADAPSRFSLQQRLRLERGRVKRISSFEPSRFFARQGLGEQLRLLFETPQNNLRLFVDGASCDPECARTLKFPKFSETHPRGRDAKDELGGRGCLSEESRKVPLCEVLAGALERHWKALAALLRLQAFAAGQEALAAELFEVLSQSFKGRERGSAERGGDCSLLALRLLCLEEYLQVGQRFGEKVKSAKVSRPDDVRAGRVMDETGL